MKRLISLISAEIRELARWWAAEFADLVTNVRFHGTSSRTQSLVLTPDGRKLRLWVTTGKVRSEEVLIERAQDGEWPVDPLGEALKHVHKMRSILLIPERDALSRVLRIPLAAERNLASVVTLAMERELPLPPDQLATEWRLVGREPNWLLVRISAVHRARLQEIHALAEKWGLKLLRIAIAPRDFDGVDLRRISGNLMERQKVRVARPWTASQKRLALVTSAAALMALGVTAGQWVYERVRLAGSLREARAASTHLVSLQNRFEAEAGPAVEMSQGVKARDALGVLVKLTESVAADSWAHDLKIQRDAKGGFAVELRGRSPSGTALVQQLQVVPGFKDVKLVANPPPEFGTQKEQFTISLRWEDPS